MPRRATRLQNGERDGAGRSVPPRTTQCATKREAVAAFAHRAPSRYVFRNASEARADAGTVRTDRGYGGHGADRSVHVVEWAPQDEVPRRARRLRNDERDGAGRSVAPRTTQCATKREAVAAYAHRAPSRYVFRNSCEARADAGTVYRSVPLE